MSQDINLTSLVINKMTKSQYDSLVTKNANELYFITDNSGIVAGTGLTLNGYTINHTNQIAAATIGTSSATSGTTVTIPYIIYDAQGHITGGGTHNHTVTGFTTESDVNTLIGAAIGGISSFNVEVVESLPTTDIDTHTIYFLSNSGTGTDIYDEYMYINNAWEKIGSTQVDLSGYVPTSRKVNSKTLTADITLTASDVGALSSSVAAASITSTDISNWNAKSDFSGSYNDLTNTPTIPSATSQLNNDSNFIAVSAYTTTLSTAQWSNATPSTYTYSNASITCGKDGTVPPIITCTSGQNAYSTISSAVATSGTGIVFTAPSSPTIAIDLVIIDYS